jgi:uncharacterized protein involved in exopolysaccharide biosynthesis
MTADRESRLPPPDLEAEREIDFGLYFRRIAVRWWLLAAGIVIGAVIGVLAATASSNPYEAKVVVYLGKPLFPGTTTPIENLPAKLTTTGQLASSDVVVASVAAKVGVRPARLRAAISTVSVGVQGETETPTSFQEITVQGLPRKKAIAAADALARIVVNENSKFTNIRLKTFRQNRKRVQQQLELATQRIAYFQKRSAAIMGDKSLSTTDRLILTGSALNQLQFYESRQSDLEASLLTSDDTIALATQVELARIVQPAKITRASPPSRRTAAAIGAVIGLLVGIIAALLWDPVATRIEKRQQPE